LRAALAILAALLVALGAAAPHQHAGAEGSHGCMACVARAGEEAVSATPDVRPLALPPGTVFAAPAGAPAAGFPLGAVPGQSPPRA
jgi:hypothetical protein